MARIEPFYLVIVDDDRHLFSVQGPMSDDTSWNNRVYQAQERGRPIRCYTPGRGQTRDQVVNGAKNMGLTETSETLA
jgi:hypothetical protein